MASQDIALRSETNRTKVETFLAKKGSLVVKMFHSVGTAPAAYGTSIEMTTLRCFEPGSEQFCSEGIRVEITERDSGQPSISFLDLDEVESLIQAIEYMNGLIARSLNYRGDYMEVIFSTKGQLEVGFYIGDKLQAFVKSPYCTAYVQPGSLPVIRDLLRAGQSQLQETRAGMSAS